MSQPLTEKYRPKVFNEILGNEVVVDAIKSLVEKNGLPNMLFYGPPGTGKTTTIRAIAQKIYPEWRLNVLELNASDERGIQVVRENIKSFASTSMSGQVKLIILDEADSMTRDAQNALRRIIEDFSENARFCFIANYSHKIIPAILSRCCKFRFGPVKNKIGDRILKVCKEEGIKIYEDGLEAMLKIFDGDMRKLMNDIEGMKSSFGIINEANVFNFNNIADKSVYKKMFDGLCTLSFDELCRKMDEITRSYSMDVNTILQEISLCVRDSSLLNKMNILKCLSDIEYRVSLGCSQSIQSKAIVGAFITNRN